MTCPLVRLHNPLDLNRVRVDRTFPGRVLGVSILTTGPALGHGFQIDHETVERVVALGEGIKGRWTHGAACADALARHLGEWSNLRAESFQLCRPCRREAPGGSCSSCGSEAELAWRAVGDFAFAESAWKLKPDGVTTSAPDYLMSRAEEDPRSLGVSIVARLEAEEAEGEDEARLARIPGAGDLLRADWVADPAANPTGLSSEATDPILVALDRLVTREGQAAAKLRALGFLARYFGDEGEEATSEAPPAELAELSELKAQVETLLEEVASLRQERSAGLVEQLKREAVALGAPLRPQDLAAVQSLLDAGSTEAAETLGEAFLTRSRAQDQTPVPTRSRTPLATGPTQDEAQRSLRAQAAVVEATGLLSTLDTLNRFDLTSNQAQ